MEPVIIKTSTAKLIRNIFFCLVFIALSYFIWGLESNRYPKELIYIVSALCFVFSIVGIVFFIKNLLSKDKVALIIDERGITEKSTAVSLGLVPWEDITEIGTTTLKTGMFNKSHFITVMVKNPQDYIAKSKNAMVRHSLNWSMEKCGSPINITATNFSMKHEEVEKLLIDAFNYYKPTSTPIT